MTPDQCARFLELIAAGESVTTAAELADVDRREVYRLAARDAAFHCEWLIAARAALNRKIAGAAGRSGSVGRAADPTLERRPARMSREVRR